MKNAEKSARRANDAEKKAISARREVLERKKKKRVRMVVHREEQGLGRFEVIIRKMYSP